MGRWEGACPAEKRTRARLTKDGEDGEEAERQRHGGVGGLAGCEGAAWWKGRSGEAVAGRVVLMLLLVRRAWGLVGCTSSMCGLDCMEQSAETK